MKYIIFSLLLLTLFGCSNGSITKQNKPSNNNPIVLNSSGTSKASITLQLSWIPKEINGITYVFGEGNPKEVTMSIEDIIKLNKKCRTITGSEEYEKSCQKKLSDNGEVLSDITLPDGSSGLSHVSIMTPEIEYLAYTFLSDSLIKESSVKCADVFWKNGEEGAPVYNAGGTHEDMGEIISENWWNPYEIDINKLIFINKLTGRKELNIDTLWTFKTQISFPSVGSGIIDGNYTNPKLIECLQKNNILAPLQRHVNYYYERFIGLWRGINIINNNPQ